MSTDQKTEFAPADWTEEDTRKAAAIWVGYQKTHDLSDRKGRIAGIDPETGEVWLGEWFTDIVKERREKGLFNPLWFERIGYPTALRKRRFHPQRHPERNAAYR